MSGLDLGECLECYTPATVRLRTLRRSPVPVRARWFLREVYLCGTHARQRRRASRALADDLATFLARGAP